MAQQHVGGNVTVHQSGTSTITAGILHVATPVSISQNRDGSFDMQIAGSGQGADNNAQPIGPSHPATEHEISMDDIEWLCNQLGRDFIALGYRLPVSNADMEILTADYGPDGRKQVIRQMLIKWRSDRAENATREHLAGKLREIGRSDTARELLKRP